MKVIVSAAISVDGFLDDRSSKRLILSSKEDFHEIQRIRSECDAILVGAETVRKDNPSLTVRVEEFRQNRLNSDQILDPKKVTLTTSGDLAEDSKFFTEGNGEKIVYCPAELDRRKKEALGQVCSVRILSEGRVTAADIIEDLKMLGVQRLLIEGGQKVFTMFFEEDAVHEFRLAVAPFFVGDEGAPRLVGTGTFPWDKDRHMDVLGVKTFGDTVAMTLVPKKMGKD